MSMRIVQPRADGATARWLRQRWDYPLLTPPPRTLGEVERWIALAVSDPLLAPGLDMAVGRRLRRPARPGRWGTALVLSTLGEEWARSALRRCRVAPGGESLGRWRWAELREARLAVLDPLWALAPLGEVLAAFSARVGRDDPWPTPVAARLMSGAWLGAGDDGLAA